MIAGATEMGEKFHNIKCRIFDDFKIKRYENIKKQIYKNNKKL
jgi:hypothetical protein